MGQHEQNIHINPVHNGNYVFFAAGSGVTPIMSMIKTILGQEPLSKITLYYSNKSQENKIFSNEFVQLQKKYPALSIVDFFDEGKKLERNDIEALLNKENQQRLFYVCGPKGYMDFVKAELKYLGVDQGSIQSEEFVTATTKKSDPINQKIISNLSVVFGKTEQIVIYENETLLDAMIRSELNVPYSCQSGVCGTCKCRLQSGTIAKSEMKTLTEQEIIDGYILSCQSIPTSDKIQVMF